MKGNLLLIHGTGDDNVHYQNCEMLVNELVRHGKIFSQISYPMRSHGIYEGEGTSLHLRKTMADYWLKTCLPEENKYAKIPADMIIQSAILNISETFHIHKMIRVQIFHKSSGWQTDKPISF